MGQGTARNSITTTGVTYTTISLTSSNTFTFSNSHNILKVNNSSTSSVYLYSTPSRDQMFIVKSRHNSVIYPITIFGNGKLIDGLSSFTINVQNASYNFLYDGNEYIII